MPPKIQSNFDPKITWAIIFTVIGFLGSYYLVYSEVKYLAEEVKEIKQDVKELRRQENVNSGRLTTIEINQKHLEITVDRLVRRIETAGK